MEDSNLQSSLGINERMAILVVAGGILGFGYSEAVQGHSFIAPSALGVGLLVAVIFGQLTQNGFGKWM